ncbi:MAG: polysaccharide biosynthesis tyrosine autokinase [Bacteroidales bacterium]|nr:polysaccharide biosynthesis tyrosine autokinase [Bacteroidales bacterium]
MDSENNNNTSPHNHRIADDSIIDFKKYFFGIIANWYWFLISLILGLGAAWLINRYTPPVYKVTGSLIISEDKGRGLTGYENMIPGMEIYRTQKAVLNEIEILKSYTLSYRTLDELDFNITYMGVGRSGIKETYLYNASPFIVIPDSGKTNLNNYPVYISILNRTHYQVQVDDNYDISETVAFGEPFNSRPFNFTIKLKDPEHFSPEDAYNKYYFKFNSKSTLINNFRGRLGIYTNDQKRGSVLFLTLSGYNPQQISDYLNALMQVYINNGLEEKNQTAINTVNFIDKQLGILDTSLRIAELNLQDFRLKNQIIDIDAEGSVVFARMEELQNSKSLLELQFRYFDYLKEYITDRNNMNMLVVPSVLDISDPLLSQLISELNSLLKEKENLLFTALPGNPKIAVLESKIESVRLALLDNLQYLYKNKTIQLKDIEKQLRNSEQELQKFPVTERLLIGIQRQYKVNDQIYTYLLQKRAEAAIAKATNVSDNKILDMARRENAGRISPNTRSNTIIGFLIGILLPLGILILLDLLVNKITSRSDIEKKTSIPIISNIGHSAGAGEIPVFESPKSALAESFRGLRTNLQYMLTNKDKKVITITSTISGEGKTFCSTNLAAIFAMAGKKTLLMGFDLRKPKIHKIFNIENKTGLTTCLIGNTSLSEIIKASKIENLFIAPSGPVPPNPAELLSSQAMTDLILEARKNYDIIILDTPPFGMVTDARIIARISDLNLFLLRQNYSPLNILGLLEDVNQSNELKSMGIIMNDIKNKGYYGYGYRYYNSGYTYGYGYYNTYGNYGESKEQDS